MKAVVRLAAALLALALQGCGAPQTLQAPAFEGRTTCADGAQLTEGAFLASNNTWNKRDAVGPVQCVGIADAGEGRVKAQLAWSWPVRSDGVRAYPELVYGHQPWHARSTTPQLPRVVDTIGELQARGSFAQSREPGAVGNLAFDIWLASAPHRWPGSDRLPITHELMIWLDGFGGMRPAGTLVETVMIDGIAWDLYRTMATWKDEPWMYLAYKARSVPPSPMQLNLRAFLDHLKQRGLVTGQEWLTAIEIGNEVVTGRGSTTLGDFGISLR